MDVKQDKSAEDEKNVDGLDTPAGDEIVDGGQGFVCGPQRGKLRVSEKNADGQEAAQQRVAGEKEACVGFRDGTAGSHAASATAFFAAGAFFGAALRGSNSKPTLPPSSLR